MIGKYSKTSCCSSPKPTFTLSVEVPFQQILTESGADPGFSKWEGGGRKGVCALNALEALEILIKDSIEFKRL